jgi:hypothetical protein
MYTGSTRSRSISPRRRQPAAARPPPTTTGDSYEGDSFSGPTDTVIDSITAP